MGKTLNNIHRKIETNAPTVNLNTILCTNGFANSYPTTFLLDLGAAVSVVWFGSLSNADHKATIKTDSLPVSANGTALRVEGQIKLIVSLGDYDCEHIFVVIRDLTVNWLLGPDFLKNHGAFIDCKSGTLSLGQHTVPIHNILQDALQPRPCDSDEVSIVVMSHCPVDNLQN